MYHSVNEIILKWTFGDSNPGPTGYEPVALTNWAKGPQTLSGQLQLFAEWLQRESNPCYRRERAMS